MDPTIISIDTETYGACERAWDGTVLPPQTVFDPRKAVDIDGVDPRHRILITTITVPLFDPRTSGTWDTQSLSAMVPGASFVFKMWMPSHRRMLIRWLHHTDTLLGQNLPFDLGFLLMEPDIRKALGTESHTLIDLSVLNYLEDENRPEKSLKSIGPVLGRFAYDHEATLNYKRFPHPDWEDRKGRGLYSYGCEDTHNVILGISELARRIRQRYGAAEPSNLERHLPGYGRPGYTSKASPRSVQYYSNCLWMSTALQTAGVAMDLASLQTLEHRLLRRCNLLRDRLGNLGIIIDGVGSQGSKQNLIDGCAKWVARKMPDIYEHLELTEKRRDIKFDDHNRNLLMTHIPRTHLRHKALSLATRFVKAQKLVSTYTFPLLRHKRTKETSKASRLIRRSSGIGIAHPTWYVTPGPPKDGGGDEGGTVQARMTCKNPPLQTMPQIIKKRVISRSPHGCTYDFDLSQIELRVVAVLSGEQTMLAEYAKGAEADLHLLRAKEIFEDSTLTKDQDAERQVGKTVNFADIFDAQALTMQFTCMEMIGLDRPLKFFQDIVDNRKKDRPQLWQWQRDVTAHANALGYLELPFIGFSRAYTGGVRREDRSQVVNQPVQSLAAAVMNDILFRIRQKIPKPWGRKPWVLLTHQVYDAGYFDLLDRERVGELAHIIDTSVAECATRGLWYHLQDLTGNQCPLLT